MIYFKIPWGLTIGFIAQLLGTPHLIALGIAIGIEMLSLVFIFLRIRKHSTKIASNSLFGLLLWQYTANPDISIQDIITLAFARILAYLLIMTGATIAVIMGALLLLASMTFYSR